MPFENGGAPTSDQPTLYRVPLLGALAPQDQGFVRRAGRFDDLEPDPLVDQMEKSVPCLAVPQPPPQRARPAGYMYDETLVLPIHRDRVNARLLGETPPVQCGVSGAGTTPKIFEHGWHTTVLNGPAKRAHDPRSIGNKLRTVNKRLILITPARRVRDVQENQGSICQSSLQETVKPISCSFSLCGTNS